jgi:hypothetical protein|tara:strand:+ start:608 stop:1081 length:474 start_codon:yes stop_codon:yes gene_type:complete
MIEQIYTYFTVEMIFMWLNLGVLPFWLILIIFPESQVCRVFTASIFPIFILSLAYAYLLYLLFNEGYDFIQNFELYLGLNAISNLFTYKAFIILFWLHFLAINLFCGSWIVKDSQKFGINKLLVSFPLLMTYFIGPIGITLYWIIRIFYSKKVNLYD